MGDRITADRGNTPASPRGAFGPWLRALGDCERCVQLRSLAALAAVLVGSSNPLVTALRCAERDDDALARAYALLEALPSLPKRRLLATYQAVEDAGKCPALPNLRQCRTAERRA
jgi:hypothetical protein